MKGNWNSFSIALLQYFTRRVTVTECQYTCFMLSLHGVVRTPIKCHLTDTDTPVCVYRLACMLHVAAAQELSAHPIREKKKTRNDSTTITIYSFFGCQNELQCTSVHHCNESCINSRQEAPRLNELFGHLQPTLYDYFSIEFC